jgi:hypothetical protein
MALKKRHGQIKSVLASMPRGTPFGLDSLAKLGVSAQLAAHYANNRWLVRLGQGVYALPGEEPTRDGSLIFLQHRVKGLHIAGKSALAAHGIRHYLQAKETLVLWGDDRFTLPAWFTSRFPARYHSPHLFDWPKAALAQSTLTTPPGFTKHLLVSCPERACIEYLDEVGTRESLDEAKQLFESVRNLRTDVVGTLLSCCTSVKAVRLFLTLARQANTFNVDDLRKKYPLRVGSTARWMNRLPDGTLLTLKQYG